MAKFNRRDFFRAAGAVAASGAGAHKIPTLSAAATEDGAAVYTRIGVRPFINLTATITTSGGTLTLPEVKKAMEEASYYSVNLDELMTRAGERIAALLQAESAIVTSGAAAALTLATAACVAGADPERFKQLPDVTGLKNEVIMPKQSRNAYDHAIRAAGVQIVEIDSKEEFYAALGRRTAMIAVLGSGEAKGKVRLEEISEAGHKLGVPLLVDAAAELPLRPNPYLSRGADLIAYSGGKIIRGPQCAGLLLGRKNLVQAAWINCSPHHALGRMMKVGKEEVMGMLAAVEAWVQTRDLQAEYRQWEAWLAEIGQAITRVPGVRVQMQPPAGASPFPVMNVEWDPEKIPITGGELYRILLDGEPRIMSHAGGEGHSFLIRPVSIKPGQHRLVAERLSEVFSEAAKRPKKPAAKAPVASIEGRWEVDVEFVAGSSRHSFMLEVTGNQISGIHLGSRLRGDVKGTIDGDRVRIHSRLPYEGTDLGYTFLGKVSGDRMSGELDLGEFGQGRWSARSK